MNNNPSTTIYCVFDCTDRNKGSNRPVAVAVGQEAAMREVERLRKGLPEYAAALIYYNTDIPVVV